MHADFSTAVITYGWWNPTKANKTTLNNFYPCVRTHRPAPFLSQTVTLGGPPAPSLKCDVIDEWPHVDLALKSLMDRRVSFQSLATW